MRALLIIWKRTRRTIHRTCEVKYAALLLMRVGAGHHTWQFSEYRTARFVARSSAVSLAAPDELF